MIGPCDLTLSLPGWRTPEPKAPRRPVRRTALETRPSSAEPVVIEVPHAEGPFRVTVTRRAAARRFTLRVASATGAVALSMPEGASLPAARAFAEAHAGWIATRLRARPRAIPFAPGEVVLRGVAHRIVHWSQAPGAARATRDAEGAPVIAVTGGSAHVARKVRDFLTREARRDLEAAVARHTAALGIPARKVTIRDTTSRWGSCSARGHLNFSWRLILAPPFVLDYLAAHEVAHLKELNHSHRFWALVGRLYPEVDKAERWLKRHGAELHRYG